MKLYQLEVESKVHSANIMVSHKVRFSETPAQVEREFNLNLHKNFFQLYFSYP